MAGLLDLPDEVLLLEILGRLPKRDVMAVRATNRRLCALATDPSLHRTWTKASWNGSWSTGCGQAVGILTALPWLYAAVTDLCLDRADDLTSEHLVDLTCGPHASPMDAEAVGMGQLVRLNLAGARAVGISALDSITRLRHLEILDLSYASNLSKMTVDSLASLQHLRVLSLRAVRIAMRPPVWAWPNVESIDLTGCVGIDKDVLLEDLAANACASTVASLGLLLTTTAKHPTCDWTAWLSDIPALTSLDADYRSTATVLPVLIGECPQITRLSLGNGPYGADFFAALLPPLALLRSLSLFDCGPGDVTELARTVCGSGLEALDLTGGDVSGADLRALAARCTALTALNLTSTGDLDEVGFHALRSFARPPLRVDLAYVYNIDAEMEAGLVAGGKVQICSLTLLA